MSTVVKLSQVVEALEYPEEWQCFLDRNTGKIITITENEEPYLEEDDAAVELDDLPVWQRNSIEEVRRDLEGAELVDLPSKFDVHEWEIMKRFSSAQDEPTREELLDAIHGSGAFRLFRRTTERLGLRNAWFEYRAAALKEIAREWLEANGIAYVEE